jgi:hypothetical protein
LKRPGPPNGNGSLPATCDRLDWGELMADITSVELGSRWLLDDASFVRRATPMSTPAPAVSSPWDADPADDYAEAYNDADTARIGAIFEKRTGRP